MEGPNLFSLPSEIVEYILSFCSYDFISNCRLVCKGFDQCGQQLLNQGFVKVDKYHAQIQKLIKGKLPRRESERRNHLLAKHVNALSAIETRLSLLNMTYMKYIDMGQCCFIPGKVLDELFVVLRALEDINTQPRTHELLQELRDISSMAMEHFDDKIVPVFKKNLSAMTIALNTSLPVPSMPVTPATGGPFDNMCLSWSLPPKPSTSRQGIRQNIDMQIRHRLMSSPPLASLGRETIKTIKDTKKQTEIEKKILEQNKVINQQNQRICEQEKSIQEMSQSLVEYDHKFNELFTEIARLRAELGMEDSAIVKRALIIRQQKTADNIHIDNDNNNPLSTSEFMKRASVETANRNALFSATSKKGSLKKVECSKSSLKRKHDSSSVSSSALGTGAQENTAAITTKRLRRRKSQNDKHSVNC